MLIALGIGVLLLIAASHIAVMGANGQRLADHPLVAADRRRHEVQPDLAVEHDEALRLQAQHRDELDMNEATEAAWPGWRDDGPEDFSSDSQGNWNCAEQFWER